jgi:hypothetical protein
MSTNSFPVFGEDGRLEGDLMDGDVGSGTVSADAPTAVVSLASLPDSAFVAPAPTMLFHDRVAEQQAREQEWHRLQMQLHPELTKAHDLLLHRQSEVRRWVASVGQKEAEVSRLTTLAARATMSLSYEDGELGSRRERLASAQASLREAVEELLAAREEMQAAEQKVDSLTVRP